MDSKKILLIEDDIFLSSLLKNRFQKEGVKIIYSKDGEDVIKILTETKPDLILLDIMLPKKSGFEIMEEIRSDPQLQIQNVPIVIISNLGQPEDISKGEQLGAAGYLIKAKTSIDDLIKKVKTFLTNNLQPTTNN
ncbi:MAG TPA: response regulator [Candidatus Wolfebacteria bacterium]|nr:response regulator [Candidatus Wolfebacteria bacterium]